MSEIKGGCVTAIAGHGKVRDVTFSNGRHGTLLTITPEGQLIPHPGLSRDEVTKEIVALLVEEFGLAYGQALRAAEDKADAAKAETRRTKLALAGMKQRAEKAEASVKKLLEKMKEDDQ